MKMILGLLLVLLTAVPALGADVKISALPLGSAATAGINDSFPFVSTATGVTKRMTLYDIANLPSIASQFAALSGSPTFTGAVTASHFYGPLTGNVTGIVTGSLVGNASTATALAANPTDCAGGAYAIQIDAGGNLTCASVAFSQLTGSISAAQIPALLITNGMLAGSISYSKLVLAGAILNSDLAGSIAYSKLSLTGAILNADLAGSIADSKLSTISTAGKVSNSATTATNLNTASAIVARDGSGNFTAGTITAALTGNVTGNVSGSAGSFTGSLVGDVTGTQGATVVGKINGTSLSGLSTGILKNTTTTGVPSIAIAADFPTLNQNTTGTAANITASSNSSLTTLSALSLPTSQLSGSITNSQLSTMAATTIKGNSTGGSTTPSDLSATVVTAMLNAMVGDSGSGGTKGLVPAPAAGDAAAGKVLKADGTWGSAGTSSPLTTNGDLYYYNSANARLPIGSTSNILSVVSGLPSWITAPFTTVSSTVKSSQSTIDINGGAQILTGTADPTSVATSAPIGSIYLNSSTGISYRKLDAGSSTNWSDTSVSTLTPVAPTKQTFTSGSGTYTLPAGVAYVRVRLVGAGGGGGGGGSGGGAGGGAGTTTFGSSLISATGGGAGLGGNSGGATGPVGGAGTVSAPAVQIAAFSGGGGGGANNNASTGTYIQGGAGGVNPFGGGGKAGAAGTGAGGDGAANTGGGGGGGGAGTASGSSGTGGGAGGYAEAIISSPSATYSYSVGAGGSAGTGSGGGNGGAGAAGYIEVTEYYGASGSVLNPANSLDVLGQVNYVLGSTCPTGSIAADGSAISRTTYAQLFTRIGTTYGVGNGSTTFNVPDLRGIFIRGAGTSGTYTNANGVAYSGTLGTEQNDQMQGHKHNQNVEQTFQTTSGSGLLVPYSGNVSAFSGATSTPITDGSDGTPRTGVETRPVNISLTPCISNATIAMPVIANSVTSSSSGVTRTEHVKVATICSSSPCTLTDNPGSWVTSITRSGTGAYTVNFAVAFTTAPSCRIQTIYAASGNFRNAIITTTETTTSFGFNTYVTNTAANEDSAFNVFCDGTK